MKILALNAGGCAVLELENTHTPYYSPEKFSVSLNGKIVREEDKNVFCLFGLKPDTTYTVEALGESAVFMLPKALFDVDVRVFGAVGDGVHDDTAAFTAAINCLPANSVLRVKRGDYLIKQIFLKSGVTLYLEKGATLYAATDRRDYPVLPAIITGNGGELNLGTWQGEEADCFASAITAVEQRDICIVGEGVIDCRAQCGDWYIDHRKKRIAWRPRGVFFNRCRDVTMIGITVKNTPSWNIHPYFCRDVGLYALTLENPESMPTTDGIDPDCCDGVVIAGTDISVGDDCIALKSGTLGFANKYKAPCKNIVIRNCLMRKGHGGVVFGSELSGGIENVTVSQSLFCGTDRGLRIKTRRGRGRTGKCGDVVFEDVRMVGVKVPFVINMYYNMGDESGHTEYVWTTEKLPVDDRTPSLGAFTFRNIECTGAEFCAGAFYGLPESPVKSVTLENVAVSFNVNAEAGFPDMREKNVAVRRGGFIFDFVGQVTLGNVALDGCLGEAVVANGVDKLKKE